MLHVHVFYADGNKGISNLLVARNNQAKPIDQSLVPAVNEAVTMCENNGGEFKFIKWLWTTSTGRKTEFIVS